MAVDGYYTIPEEELSGWERQALCSISPNKEKWFSRDKRRVREAKDICKSCPVMEICLQASLDLDGDLGLQEGIWGGMTPRERSKEKKKRDRLRSVEGRFLNAFFTNFLDKVVDGSTEIYSEGEVIRTWVRVEMPQVVRIPQRREPYQEFYAGIWTSPQMGVMLGIQCLGKGGQSLHAFKVEELPLTGEFIVDDGVTTHRKTISSQEWERIVRVLDLETFTSVEKQQESE